MGPPTRAAVALSLSLMAAAPAFAGQQGGPIDYATVRLDRRLTVRRAPGPIVIDGRLDEAAWVDAAVAKDFIQNDPREGEPAS